MLENTKKKKNMLSRKKVIQYFILIMLIAYGMGIFMYNLAIDIQYVIDIRIIQVVILVLFPLATLLMWLPLFVAGAQIYDMNEEELVILPAYSDRKKWGMILHVVSSDDVSPYLQRIAYKDVDHALFTVDRHAGNWGMSRYSYLLKLYDTKGLLTSMFINPMANGMFMPAGKGGIPLDGYKSRDEISNMLQFLATNGLKIEDPYQIQEALKNHDIEVYDFLESLHIKTRY